MNVKDKPTHSTSTYRGAYRCNECSAPGYVVHLKRHLCPHKVLLCKYCSTYKYSQYDPQKIIGFGERIMQLDENGKCPNIFCVKFCDVSVQTEETFLGRVRNVAFQKEDNPLVQTNNVSPTSDITHKQGEVKLTIEALKDFKDHDTSDGVPLVNGIMPPNVTFNTCNLDKSSHVKNKRAIAEAMLDFVCNKNKVTVTIGELKDFDEKLCCDIKKQL